MTGVLVLGVIVGVVTVGTFMAAGALRIFERVHRR